MAICQNPVTWKELQHGKKYNVFEETGDAILFTGWFVCSTTGRGPQVYLSFRLDKRDTMPPNLLIPQNDGPPSCAEKMYGAMTTAGEPGEEYKLIEVYTVGSFASSDIASTYRYCLVNEGGKRRRKTNRRKTRTRRNRRR